MAAKPPPAMRLRTGSSDDTKNDQMPHYVVEDVLPIAGGWLARASQSTRSLSRTLSRTLTGDDVLYGARLDTAMQSTPSMDKPNRWKVQQHEASSGVALAVAAALAIAAVMVISQHNTMPSRLVHRLCLWV
jgi:hypothetical protein